MLELILLGFLQYGPKTGYELKSLMEDSTVHFWHAYHSQIYTTLRRLEADGLVVSELAEESGTLRPRVYTITEEGQQKVQEWLNTPLTARPPIKEPLLVRIFFSAQRDYQAVLNELYLMRQLHQQQLDLYNSMSLQRMLRGQPVTQALRRESRFWTRTLEFGKAFEQMYLQWLDETIAFVEQQKERGTKDE